MDNSRCKTRDQWRIFEPCEIVPCHVKHTHEDVDGKTQAQIALAREHASRRSADAVNIADQAVRCNRNAVTKQFAIM